LNNKNSFYSDADFQREYIEPGRNTTEHYRSEFRRDYARLVHSSAFRRLVGKTQLFPSVESDFFRNRLTHSLEVAQVAKSIAIRINNTVDYFSAAFNQIDVDLVETAALAHDLGHPPFGHNGEKALDDCMLDYGGFEGNAQTLRILARLEKKEPLELSPCGITVGGIDARAGLNLTYRTLAAVLKYDEQIPEARKNGELVKGYYQSENNLVSAIKTHVTGGGAHTSEFKTIECYIMDLADDIAYSTYDLEDALKAGFLTPLDIISASEQLLERIAKKVSKEIKRPFDSKDVMSVLLDIFEECFDLESLDIKLEDLDLRSPYTIAHLVSTIYRATRDLGNVGYLRTKFTSDLVGQFIQGISVEVNEAIPALSKVTFNNDIHTKVEVLKHLTFESVIMSPRLKVVEYRGYDIVKTIFESLASVKRSGADLLPDDFQGLYRRYDIVGSEAGKMRTICDFISGMTDRYAVEFYGRLKSENAYTIFKPL